MRYLSVKEFAALAGVTPQGIYKSLKNDSSPLNQFVNKVDGCITIAETALEAVYGVVPGVEQPEVQVTHPKETGSESHTEALIASLNEQIEFLKLQIQQKDTQIAELLTLSSRALNTTSQQQYLTAVATGNKPDEQPIEQQEETIEQPKQPVEQPSKRRTWLNLFFRS